MTTQILDKVAGSHDGIILCLSNTPFLNEVALKQLQAYLQTLSTLFMYFTSGNIYIGVEDTQISDVYIERVPRYIL